ncbi:MAG: dihydrofolate reductase [Propionibacteriaceae bacterium]|jgi:dihydrofolate reductase|nr:dihydrofolate reductase [Propionibacteriaceae bacterium]
MEQLWAIAAVARNGVIGNQGQLPWHLPEDLARYAQVTAGATLIMGRTTYETFGEMLIGRRSIVITHREFEPTDEAVAVSSLAEALALARQYGQKTFINGGASVYHEAWPWLTDLDLTEVDAEPTGDAFFPEIDPAEWEEVSREPHDGFAFVHYRRYGTDS